MDIKQTTAPAPVKSQGAEKTETAKEGRSGQVGAPAFSQLLQGLDGLVDVPQQVLEPLTHQFAHTELAIDGFALNGFEGGLDISSLVGQTQSLDAVDADAAMQDGSFVWAQQEAGLGTALAQGQGWGAQPRIAAGQHVATVAAGVSGLPHAAVNDGLTAGWHGEALPELAREATSPVAQLLADGLKTEANSEGRVTLQGAWKLEDPQSPLNPALQRLMGQIEQWAAASAAGQPKALERVESSKNGAVAADGVSSGQSSGMRLTENAVKEAQPTQDTAFESHNDAPVQDMRFWLQGKQQRAEVVLEKDGQPVRVQVAVHGNEAQVIFRADQAHTRDLLDASLAQLREMLEQQGLQLTGASVQADARGDQSGADGGQRNLWGAAPTQHAQVVVPLEDAIPARPHRPQGLDVYA